MKRAILLFALTTTACASPGPREYPGVKLKPSANPTAVIAAELAFAQLAQTKGQWTAFRETATADAVMFVPQRVNAQSWLKGKADPAVSVKWQPHQVWSSCDGSYAVTRGAWQRPNSVGYFTTVWQRQKNGGYKWVLDQGDAMAMPMDPPEMIAAKVADCKGLPPIAQVTAAQPDRRAGLSDDRTLSWAVQVDPQCGRSYRLSLWDGTKMAEVMSGSVEPPPPGDRPVNGCT
jgi:hypothetical protein